MYNVKERDLSTVR